jgi:hypothetical protein
MYTYQYCRTPPRYVVTNPMSRMHSQFKPVTVDTSAQMTRALFVTLYTCIYDTYILQARIDRQTDRHTEIHTDRQTDRQTYKRNHTTNLVWLLNNWK